jgi:hypothetical protein
MKTLVLAATLLGVMPATLQIVPVRGRAGETCYVLVDANNTPLALHCSRRSWET